LSQKSERTSAQNWGKVAPDFNSKFGGIEGTVTGSKEYVTFDQWNTFPPKYSLKILRKSKHFPRKHKRKREQVIFSVLCVLFVTHEMRMSSSKINAQKSFSAWTYAVALEA